MIYEETLYIDRATDKELKKYLGKNATREEDNLPEGTHFVITAAFPDGTEMDVKLCGVQYEEGSNSNRPWTEAVLFKNHAEVSCTEVEEEFVRDWEMPYDGNVYITHVRVLTEEEERTMRVLEEK